jgi:hypothetical protein
MNLGNALMQQKVHGKKEKQPIVTYSIFAGFMCWFFLIFFTKGTVP